MRVRSPAAGIPVRFKIENAGDPAISVETETLTTAADTWETLTFDFSNEVSGTAAFNPASTYNKIAIFFNFGTDGATAGAQTFYFDDIAVGSSGGGGRDCLRRRRRGRWRRTSGGRGRGRRGGGGVV